MDWKMFAFGCLGGLLPDVLRLIKGRYATELPSYLSSPAFYLGLLLLVLLGGAAAWLAEAAKVKEALAYGFAAPELFAKLVSSNKELNLGKSSFMDRTRRFWAY